MIRIPARKQNERRRAPRAPLCLNVAAESDAWMGACLSRDISESGVFLICQRLASVGSGLSMIIDLPGDLGVLRLRGTVVRIQAGDLRGMGVEFAPGKGDEPRRLREIWERFSRAFGA